MTSCASLPELMNIAWLEGRAMSGGFDGRLNSIGLSGPWSDGGSLTLGLNNPSLCWVQVSIVNHVEVSDVVVNLAFGQILWLTKQREFWEYII